MTRSDWRPILTHDDEEAAWRAIRAIAEDLPRADPPNRPAPAAGISGPALFFAYLAEATGESGAAELAVAYLDRAREGIAEHPSSPTLYGGFPGVAWTMEHLHGRLLDNDDGGRDEPTEVDTALLQMLRSSARILEYDLISGLVGIGVYAVEALPRPAARECLELVVKRLDILRERSDRDSITWFTPPGLLPSHQRKEATEGYYNLGVAHGVPGVCSLLAAICALDVARERAQTLLDGAVRWILAQRHSDSPGSCFPNWIPKGGELLVRRPRLAWCYGDLGIAAALTSVASRAKESEWLDRGLEIARSASRCRRDNVGVWDAGLCHGAAGVAHLFNRIYQATNEIAVGDAAVRWFEHCLSMRTDGVGVGGFSMLDPVRRDGRSHWRSDSSFLTGSSGVGLALLAAVSCRPSAWDSVMLIASR